MCTLHPIVRSGSCPTDTDHTGRRHGLHRRPHVLCPRKRDLPGSWPNLPECESFVSQLTGWQPSGRRRACAARSDAPRPRALALYFALMRRGHRCPAMPNRGAVQHRDAFTAVRRSQRHADGAIATRLTILRRGLAPVPVAAHKAATAGALRFPGSRPCRPEYRVLPGAAD